MQAALPFFIADGAQSQGQQFLRLQYGINIAGITLRITKGSIQLRDGPFLLAFRLLVDIHPALGSGGCFQLLQGQLNGGVTIARRRVDSIKLAQALVQIDRHALVHPKGAHTAGSMTHIGFHLIFQLPNSYSVMAQTRAGRPVAPSMRG